VRTKSDVTRDSSSALAALGAEVEAAAVVEVSAETGAGVAELVTSIERVLAATDGAPDLDAPVLTQTRHRHAIARARDELAVIRPGGPRETMRFDGRLAHAGPGVVAASFG